MKHKEINFKKTVDRMAEFAATYKGKWHSFARDEITRRAVKENEKRGMIVVNDFNQFMATPECERRFRKAV